jgi:hypothetical protein
MAHYPGDHARVEIKHVVDTKHLDCAWLAVGIKDLVEPYLLFATTLC